MGMEDDEVVVSYARKWRPTSFEGYIGNSDVKDTVRRYLKVGRPQTILLEGNSGCGKTTLARIIEKEYMCEDRDEENGACGECVTCQMFEEYIKTGTVGSLPDVYEIDATDKTGKKDMDAMLDSMEYPPVGGDWKAYMIDEAHKLSEGAMNRLLKSLEEPPEGVLIILCTTEPDALLDTIRNRCQLKLRISKPSTTELVHHLKYVCKSEGKEYDLEGLRMISSRAENVIRDSLNYLETVISTRGKATAEMVSKEFKEVNDKIIYSFYKAYCDDDYVGYSDVLYKIKTGYSFSQFLNSLTSFTLRGIYIINGVNVEGLTKEELDEYRDLFTKFTPNELSKILSDLRRMHLGNVEANLFAFIYCKGTKQEEQKSLAETVLQSNVGIKEETVFRNDNLKRLEQTKYAKGTDTVKKEMESVSLSEMSALFSLEKVNI